ncbi:MAG: hypothetical protein ABIS35_10495 [Terracoccus sp.]
MRTHTSQPSRETPGRRWWPIAVAAATLTLGACGQPSPPTDGGPSTVSVPVQPTILPLDTAVPTVNPSGAAADGLFDASQGLVDTTCSASGGAWSFTATLRNPDGVAHDFTVAITLVRTSDMTAVVTQEVPVAVPAGGSAPVSAPAFHDGDVDGVECLTGVTVKDQ